MGRAQIDLPSDTIDNLDVNILKNDEAIKQRQQSGRNICGFLNEDGSVCRWGREKTQSNCDLARHEWCHIPEPYWLYPCPQCEKRFKQEAHKKQHIISAHEKRKDSNRCSCGMEAADPSQITRHITKHAGHRWVKYLGREGDMPKPQHKTRKPSDNRVKKPAVRTSQRRQGTISPNVAAAAEQWLQNEQPAALSSPPSQPQELQVPDISPENLAEVDFYSQRIQEQWMAPTEPSAQPLQPNTLQDAYGVPAYPVEEDFGFLGPQTEPAAQFSQLIMLQDAYNLPAHAQEGIGTLVPRAELSAPAAVPAMEPVTNEFWDWNPQPLPEGNFFEDAMAVPNDISPAMMTQDSFSPTGEAVTTPKFVQEEPFFDTTWLFSDEEVQQPGLSDKSDFVF